MKNIIAKLNPEIEPHFKCKTCNQMRPSSEFYSNKKKNKRTSIDGLGRSSSCKKCGDYQNGLKNYLRVYCTKTNELVGIGSPLHPLNHKYESIKNKIHLSEPKSHKTSTLIYETFIEEETNTSVESLIKNKKTKKFGNQSVLAIGVLNHMNIPDKDREVPISGFSGKSYIVDAVKENTVIEVYGDYWHANPNLPQFRYGDTIHPTTKKPIQEIWDKDEERRKDIVNAGYHFQQYWESQIKGLNIL